MKKNRRDTSTVMSSHELNQFWVYFLLTFPFAQASFALLQEGHEAPGGESVLDLTGGETTLHAVTNPNPGHNPSTQESSHTPGENEPGHTNEPTFRDAVFYEGSVMGEFDFDTFSTHSPNFQQTGGQNGPFNTGGQGSFPFPSTDSDPSQTLSDVNDFLGGAPMGMGGGTGGSANGPAAPSNAAPTTTGIADTNVNEDAALNYDVMASFSDPDGDPLIFSLGAGAPGWLSIDPNTGVLSGTPLNSDVGTPIVTVITTDPSGASVSSPFTLTVFNTNDAPTTTGIGPTARLEDAAANIDVSGFFGDVDVGDSLTFTLDSAPAWVTGITPAGVIMGTPVDADVGTTPVTVRATDLAGAFVTSTFNLEVTNTNDAPTVSTAIPDLMILEDDNIDFTVPAATFADDDLDSGDSLSLTATLSGGGILPSWLSFDSGTGKFTSTGTDNFAGTVSVEVTATDLSLASVSDTFDIEIAGVADGVENFSFSGVNFDSVTGVLTFEIGGAEIDFLDGSDVLTAQFSGTGTGMVSFVGAGAGPAEFTGTVTVTPGAVGQGYTQTVEVFTTESGGTPPPAPPESGKEVVNVQVGYGQTVASQVAVEEITDNGSGEIYHAVHLQSSHTLVPSGASEFSYWSGTNEAIKLIGAHLDSTGGVLYTFVDTSSSLTHKFISVDAATLNSQPFSPSSILGRDLNGLFMDMDVVETYSTSSASGSLALIGIENSVEGIKYYLEETTTGSSIKNYYSINSLDNNSTLNPSHEGHIGSTTTTGTTFVDVSLEHVGDNYVFSAENGTGMKFYIENSIGTSKFSINESEFSSSTFSGADDYVGLHGTTIPANLMGTSEESDILVGVGEFSVTLQVQWDGTDLKVGATDVLEGFNQGEDQLFINVANSSGSSLSESQFLAELEGVSSTGSGADTSLDFDDGNSIIITDNPTSSWSGVSGAFDEVDFVLAETIV